MKKWLILLLVVAAVVATWWYIRTYSRFTPEANRPKFGKLTRGDITVPITAAGLIEPEQRLEVKSKASGEIIELRVAEGDYVREGDVLAVLKRDDEARNVDRAKAELDRTKALLAQAREGPPKADASIASSQARIKELVAQSTMTEFELNKIRDLRENQIDYSRQQEVEAEARHAMVLAQIEAARAALTTAESSKKEAEANVQGLEASVQAAEKTLEDAEERLEETTIVSKHNAIVTDVLVEKGMLIQSGTTSLTGGTIVMILADVSTKKVIARVDEADYGRVLDISPVTARPDMPGLRDAALKGAEDIATRSGDVTLLVDAFPDEEFTGQITRVEPQGKLNAGASVIQFDVQVEITDDQRYKLPLGAQAQVEFTVESALNVLRVPAEAVMTYMDQRGVWVKVPEGEGVDGSDRRFVPARFGITDGANTEIIEVRGTPALKEGDEVFTRLPREPKRDEES